MSWKLADLFVQFSATGVEHVKAALSQVQAKLADVAQGANAVGNIAASAFGKASLFLGGWVTAGIAASSQGQILGFQMERLARTIAGVFGPEIQKLISGITNVTEWIASLSDAQKTVIVHFIEAAAAGLLVAKMLPMLFGGMQLVVGGIIELISASTVLDVVTGGILPLLGAVVTALTGLAVGAGVFSGAMDGMSGALAPFMDMLKQLAGTLMDALKPTLGMVQQLGNTVLAAIRPLLPIFTETVQILGGALGTVLQGLVGFLIQGVAAWAQFAQAAAPLLPIIAQLVAAAMEMVTPFLDIFGILVQIGVAINGPLISAFVSLVGVVAKIIVPAMKALAVVLAEVAKFLAFITGTKIADVKASFKMSEEKPGNRGALAPRFGGFSEDPSAAFWKIAAQSVLAGKSNEEKALDKQDEANRLLGRIAGAAEREKTPVQRPR